MAQRVNNNRQTKQNTHTDNDSETTLSTLFFCRCVVVVCVLRLCCVLVVSCMFWVFVFVSFAGCCFLCFRSKTYPKIVGLKDALFLRHRCSRCLCLSMLVFVVCLCWFVLCCVVLVVFVFVCFIAYWCYAFVF